MNDSQKNRLPGGAPFASQTRLLQCCGIAFERAMIICIVFHILIASINGGTCRISDFRFAPPSPPLSAGGAAQRAARMDEIHALAALKNNQAEAIK